MARLVLCRRQVPHGAALGTWRVAARLGGVLRVALLWMLVLEKLGGFRGLRAASLVVGLLLDSDLDTLTVGVLFVHDGVLGSPRTL